MKNSIINVLEILSRKYFTDDKTTLNRMRVSKEKSPFKILVSCLLSLRARDENTEKVSANLFKFANTPQEILKLPTIKLEKLIFSSGHYHKKARTLKEVSKVLIENFNSKVPDNKEKLLSIKGIGPKTANIVLNFAFDKKVIPVDTHCHRIPNRLRWIKTKNPEQTEIELMKIIPKKYWRRFNAIFVQFGRDICLPISPLCSKCSVEKFCKKINVKKFR